MEGYCVRRRSEAKSQMDGPRFARTETYKSLRSLSISLLKNRRKKVAEPTTDAVFKRKPPIFAIGVADVGGLAWCEQKATFSQQRTEPGYVRRALQIMRAGNSR